MFSIPFYKKIERNLDFTLKKNFFFVCSSLVEPEIGRQYEAIHSFILSLYTTQKKNLKVFYLLVLKSIFFIFCYWCFCIDFTKLHSKAGYCP